MARTVGIDLGTTNSVCAVMEGGEPTIVPSSEGGRLFPSVVAVNPFLVECRLGGESFPSDLNLRVIVCLLETKKFDFISLKTESSAKERPFRFILSDSFADPFPSSFLLYALNVNQS